MTGYFLRVGKIAISVISYEKDVTVETMKDRIVCYTFLNSTASQNVPQSPHDQATTTSGVFLRIGIPPSQVK